MLKKRRNRTDYYLSDHVSLAHRFNIFNLCDDGFERNEAASLNFEMDSNLAFRNKKLENDFMLGWWMMD